MDFGTYEIYRSNGVTYYWMAGTVLSLTVMSLSFAFFVGEWATQSHLSTEDYESARNGLLMTRRFKKYTKYVRDIPNIVIEHTDLCWRRWFKRGVISHPNRRGLVWTAHTKHERVSSPRVPIILKGHADASLYSRPSHDDGGIPYPNVYSRTSHDDEGISTLLRRKPDEEYGFALDMVDSHPISHTRSPGSSFGQYDGEQQTPRPFLTP